MSVIEQINERLERLERLASLQAKSVLNFDEAMMLTGYSKNHLYCLVRDRKVPHSKQGNRLFFSKQKLENWMLENEVMTADEIEARAATYTYLNPRGRKTV